MPTTVRREDTLIERFLSAYESRSWADAKTEPLDKIIDGAVEVRATRRSDGKKLAIEHTIIEPFVGDKEDFVRFERVFLKIESDVSLAVPQRWIQVFVPVGTLDNQRKPAVRDAIANAVHNWIRDHRLSLPEGDSQYSCLVPSVLGRPEFKIPLTVKVVPLPRAGKLHVRRQQMENNLDVIIEKALRKKLPKLVKTEADKRILLLERQHMNLWPKTMLNEIDKRRSDFPELAAVDEIWIVETMDYQRSAYLRFERYSDDRLIDSFDFLGGESFP